MKNRRGRMTCMVTMIDASRHKRSAHWICGCIVVAANCLFGHLLKMHFHRYPVAAHVLALCSNGFARFAKLSIVIGVKM